MCVFFFLVVYILMIINPHLTPNNQWYWGRLVNFKYASKCTPQFDKREIRACLGEIFRWMRLFWTGKIYLIQLAHGRSGALATVTKRAKLQWWFELLSTTKSTRMVQKFSDIIRLSACFKGHLMHLPRLVIKHSKPLTSFKMVDLSLFRVSQLS